MSPNLAHSIVTTYLVIMSFLGLFLAGMLTFYAPRVQETLLWRKPLIGTIFGAVCIFGIFAVLFPTRCKGGLNIVKDRLSNPDSSELAFHGTLSTLKGHHPDCGNFTAHVFRIGGKVFCAACAGLLLGGSLAFAGTFLYFFNNRWIEQSGSLMVWLGVLGVGLGLLQFKFSSFARLSLNVLFVLGTFLILVGGDKLVQSVMVDLFLIALALLWLFTRISLSQWDHERICSACEVSPCDFQAEKRVGR